MNNGYNEQSTGMYLWGQWNKVALLKIWFEFTVAFQLDMCGRPIFANPVT